jgi:hypothetical protein
MFVFIASFALTTQTRRARAVTPAEVAAGVEAAPRVLDLASDAARVPYAAAELLYLPMGASEVVLCPLPGVNLGDGLRHLGKGLIAPFKVGVAVLRLPFNVLKHAGSVVKLVPAGKL